MKGKGIQISNKAYRNGYERTFKKDPDDGRFWNVLHLFNGTRDEIEEAIDSYSSLASCLKDIDREYARSEKSDFSAAAQWWFIRDLVLARMNKHFHAIELELEGGKPLMFSISNEEITDPGSWVKARFIKPDKPAPLMESWVLDINHFKGLD